VKESNRKLRNQKLDIGEEAFESSTSNEKENGYTEEAGNDCTYL